MAVAADEPKRRVVSVLEHPRKRRRKRAAEDYRDTESWPRGILLAMSDPRCAECKGLGGEEGRPCRCVLRAIFRAVLERLARIYEHEARPMQVRHYSGNKRAPWVSYSRQSEEFAADVHLIARRTLTERQWRVFQWHYMRGWTYRQCCARLKIERGLFFHECYRIEERLGRVFRELRPYRLFPTREYFQPPRRGEAAERRRQAGAAEASELRRAA
jgi:hypothetical protein